MVLPPSFSVQNSHFFPPLIRVQTRLNLPDTWRNVVNKFPSGMLVYVHLEKGRLTYLSGRSIEGKKHYNPPRELIGEKQPYRNPLYYGEVEQVVLVEEIGRASCMEIV